MIKRALAILTVSTLIVVGCGERPGPTEPHSPPTPGPSETPTPIRPTASATAVPISSRTATAGPAATATPTPTLTARPTASPTPAGDPLSVTVHLTHLNPPPGALHAARAAMVVREMQGRTATLTGVVTYTFGSGHFEVSGFTPRQLAPGQATSYVLTLTTTTDVPCADALMIGVSFNNGTRSHSQYGTYYDCNYGGEWLF